MDGIERLLDHRRSLKSLYSLIVSYPSNRRVLRHSHCLDARISTVLGFHLHCLIVHQLSSQPLVHQSPSMPMNAKPVDLAFYFLCSEMSKT